MTHFDTLYSIIKKPAVVMAYILILVLVFNFADRPIAHYFHHFALRSNAPILVYITFLGKSSLYAFIFILLGLSARYLIKHKIWEERACFLLACVVLCNAVASVFKLVLGRARPELLFNEQLFGFYWFKLNDMFFSFPSGHTVTVGALAAGLSILFPRYCYLFLTGALLVITTRVVLYYHYLSDVMAGLYLSLFLVGWFYNYLKKHSFFRRIL